MLCLCTTLGQDVLTARLLVVPCGRPGRRGGDDRMQAEAKAARIRGRSVAAGAVVLRDSLKADGCAALIGLATPE